MAPGSGVFAAVDALLDCRRRTCSVLLAGPERSTVSSAATSRRASSSPSPPAPMQRLPTPCRSWWAWTSVRTSPAVVARGPRAERRRRRALPAGQGGGLLPGLARHDGRGARPGPPARRATRVLHDVAALVPAPAGPRAEGRPLTVAQGGDLLAPDPPVPTLRPPNQPCQRPVDTASASTGSARRSRSACDSRTSQAGTPNRSRCRSSSGRLSQATRRSCCSPSGTGAMVPKTRRLAGGRRAAGHPSERPALADAARGSRPASRP